VQLDPAEQALSTSKPFSVLLKLDEVPAPPEVNLVSVKMRQMSPSSDDSGST